MSDEPAKCPDEKGDVAGLYVEYARRVHGLALAACQGNRHEAEEIVQETFVSVLRAHRKYFLGQPESVREARVFDIAHKRVIDRYRYNRSRKAEPSDCLDELPRGHQLYGDPLASVERRVLMDEFWRAVSVHLTPTEHRVAFLTLAMAMDDTSIKSILGIPTESTVRSHRSRAMAKLRQQLGSDVIVWRDDSETSGVGERGQL